MASVFYFAQLVLASLIFGTTIDSWLSSGPFATLVLLCGAVPFFEWGNGAHIHANRHDPVVISERSIWVLIASMVAVQETRQKDLQAVLGDQLLTILNWSLAVLAFAAGVYFLRATVTWWRTAKNLQSVRSHSQADVNGNREAVHQDL